MRNAETVLGVIRERSKRGLPLTDVYRQLFNPALYLRAYGRLYRRNGALTQGTTPETVDGMSLDRIHALIEDIRFERYRFQPARRVEIPKPNQPGKTRPLGIPTWSDKLLQEVLRSILEAYYEPRFSDRSHGFRPERGCHTALTEITHNWRGTSWFVEGDIKGCFDNIDHTVLLSILRENIHDNRFLRLLQNLFQTGYLKEWKYYPTLSGTPQGGVVSPILANIYLDRLDKFVENALVPEYTRGKKRKPHPVYHPTNLRANYLRRTGRAEEAKDLKRQVRTLPSVDPNDKDYRRLRYVRYADDFLLGFAGPKAEAEEIKERLREFLYENLKLELSPEKTLISHAISTPARFLGYDIVIQQCDSKHDRLGRRQLNRNPGLRVPAEFIETRCRRYMRDGKPIHRKLLTLDDDFGIVHTYQSEWRGYVEYYALAQNRFWLDKLHWIMRISLLKTLACKHKSTVRKMHRKYATVIRTPQGPRKCLEVVVEREGKSPLVARFGGISLKNQDWEGAKPEETLPDYRLLPQATHRVQLKDRLLAEKCEVCGATGKVEVHHIRKLANLEKKGRREKPIWVRVMAARRRKTLVVCFTCHRKIHAGTPVGSVGANSNSE